MTGFNYLFNLSQFPWISTSVIFLHNFTYPILICIFIVAIILAPRKLFALALLSFSGIGAWLVAEILKYVVHTARPFLALNLTPLVDQTGFSFPSQHMAVFSALAISMFMINKRFAVILSVLAVAMGISRVILGVHYPIDIIGGLCVGILTSFGIKHFFKKI